MVPRRSQYDLTKEAAVEQFYRDARPEIIIHLAAVVGGIGANQANPGRFFYQRLGGREIQHKTFAVGGKRVEATGYAWRDLPGFLETVARADRRPES